MVSEVDMQIELLKHAQSAGQQMDASVALTEELQGESDDAIFPSG